jgi:hypothetical protein
MVTYTELPDAYINNLLLVNFGEEAITGKEIKLRSGNSGWPLSLERGLFDFPSLKIF